MTLNPDTVFNDAIKKLASDVHVAVGAPLTYRIDGELIAQGKANLKTAEVEAFIKKVLGEKKFKEFKEEKEIDAAYSVKSGVRLRVNCHYERMFPGLVARTIPNDIPTLEDVDLEEFATKQLLNLREGLILFTGPTGAGKSTSMAALIEHINQNRSENIITLEDPIEFLFPPGKSIIRQRQFGEDFHSFAQALKRVLRQDPNIVMVGEMRDMETMAAALTLAETGHLILGTLHTPSAIQSIDRIVDSFPPHQQNQIRMQLSLSLKAIIAQRLLPAIEGGRVAQREILVNTAAVANTIRENRTHELASILQTNKSLGMTTMEVSAKKLYKEGLIDKETMEFAASM